MCQCPSWSPGSALPSSFLLVQREAGVMAPPTSQVSSSWLLSDPAAAVICVSEVAKGRSLSLSYSAFQVTKKEKIYNKLYHLTHECHLLMLPMCSQIVPLPLTSDKH